MFSASLFSSLKVSTWFFTTFSVSGMKEKVHYLDSLHQLFTCIRPEQMDIPPFVLEYDARVSCCRAVTSAPEQHASQPADATPTLLQVNGPFRPPQASGL